MRKRRESDAKSVREQCENKVNAQAYFNDSIYHNRTEASHLLACGDTTKTPMIRERTRRFLRPKRCNARSHLKLSALKSGDYIQTPDTRCSPNSLRTKTGTTLYPQTELTGHCPVGPNPNKRGRNYGSLIRPRTLRAEQSLLLHVGGFVFRYPPQHLARMESLP